MSKTVHIAGVLIENNEGQILVLLRPETDLEPNTYGLIGGGIKFWESKEKALSREVYEETKLKINPEDFKFLKTYRSAWKVSDLNINFELFSYKLDQLNPQIILDSNEAVGSLWETPRELYERKDLMIGLYVILKDIYGL